jgi:hypothetical protein
VVEGAVATEKTSVGVSEEGGWVVLPVVRGGREALFRGYWIGETASAPNCASRKRKRRARRVEGSGVRCGFGCLKRWARTSSLVGEWEWEWECCRDDSKRLLVRCISWEMSMAEDTYVAQLLANFLL